MTRTPRRLLAGTLVGVLLSAAWFVTGLAFLSACSGDVRAPARLYAPASLASVLERLPGAGAPPYTPVVAGTPLLAQQVKGGAPPGVLVAADEAWADALQADGLVAAGTRVDLLGNGLVVIAPAGSATRLDALADIGTCGAARIALADTRSVPVGRYARAALTAAGAWRAVADRVVATADARAVVALVARGEADLGITYTSDASAPGVRTVLDVPPALHPPVRYVLLLVPGAPPEARELWTWLQGPAASRVFEDAGFRRLR